MKPENMQIWHNPRCSKSRQTLELLKSKNIDPSIRLYLEDVPTEQEIKLVLKKLKLKASDIIRKGESLFKEKYKNKNLREEDIIKLLCKHPELIERPIVITATSARMGRPPENVLELL